MEYPRVQVKQHRQGWGWIAQVQFAPDSTLRYLIGDMGGPISYTMIEKAWDRKYSHVCSENPYYCFGHKDKP